MSPEDTHWWRAEPSGQVHAFVGPIGRGIRFTPVCKRGAARYWRFVANHVPTYQQCPRCRRTLHGAD